MYTQASSKYDCVRIQNDINGNPRYAVHYLAVSDGYYINKATRAAGLSRYRGKDMGGMYTFSTY